MAERNLHRRLASKRFWATKFNDVKSCKGTAFWMAPEAKRKNSCGIGPIAFIACVQTLTSIPQALSSSGKFDFHVQLAAPAAAERGALPKHEIQKRSLLCSDDILLDIASSCDGYDAYDLEILVDRSVHAAIGHFVSRGLDFETERKPSLEKDDFVQAMKGFLLPRMIFDL